MGAISKDGMDFLSDLGRRVTQSTDNHRESAFLFQRLSILIQRYNAVNVLGTFTHTTGRNVAVPAFVLVYSLVFSPRDLYYPRSVENQLHFISQLDTAGCATDW